MDLKTAAADRHNRYPAGVKEAAQREEMDLFKVKMYVSTYGPLSQVAYYGAAGTHKRQ